MKPIFKITGLLLLTAMLVSCSKEDVELPRLAGLKVVNLINDVENVIVQMGDSPITYLTTESKVAFGASENYAIGEGLNGRVRIVAENDTLSPIYSETLNIKGVNSLYLYGAPGEESSVLLEDQVKQFTDSIVGIRFINLTTTVASIDVEQVLRGTETSSVYMNLNQEQATGFIEFPAKEEDGTYAFVFKDGAGNYLPLFVELDPLQLDMDINFRDTSVKKNLSLVVTDAPNQSPAYRVTRVNSYL